MPLSPIRARFDELRSEGRAALVPYVTAGFPDPETTEQVLRGLADSGADVIELGVPFSDPLADGPTIQRSSFVALQNGMTVRGVLEAVSRFRNAATTPVVIFTYLNPVLRYGLAAFTRDARDAGAQGVLLTDLPEGADDGVRANRPTLRSRSHPARRTHDASRAGCSNRSRRQWVPLLHLPHRRDGGPRRGAPGAGRGGGCGEGPRGASSRGGLRHLHTRAGLCGGIGRGRRRGRQRAHPLPARAGSRGRLPLRRIPTRRNGRTLTATLCRPSTPFVVVGATRRASVPDRPPRCPALICVACVRIYGVSSRRARRWMCALESFGLRGLPPLRGPWPGATPPSPTAGSRARRSRAGRATTRRRDGCDGRSAHRSPSRLSQP